MKESRSMSLLNLKYKRFILKKRRIPFSIPVPVSVAEQVESQRSKAMSKTEERTNERKNAQKTSRGGNGRREYRAERNAVPDRGAIPTLRYGVDNNFPDFKKKLSRGALEMFKDLGRMFDLGEYYSPPEVEAEDYDLEDDPYGANVSDYKDARKNRNRRIEAMIADRPSMFAMALKHLSNESLDAVKLQDGWDDADKEKDPLKLWNLIEATHRVGTTSQIPAWLKSESRRAYQVCAQSAYESIVRFKERFDDLLTNYVEHDNPELSQLDIAMDFYRALDNSRYAAFKTNLVNNINSGAIEQPANLNEMYTQAGSYLIPTRGHQPQGGGTNRTAFATTSEGRPSRGRRRDYGEQRERGPPHSGKDPFDDDRYANTDCWGCGELGHTLQHCPKVKKTETASVDTDKVINHTFCFADHALEDLEDWSSESDGEPEQSDMSPAHEGVDPAHERGGAGGGRRPVTAHGYEPEIDVDKTAEDGQADSEEQTSSIAYLTAPKTTDWYEVLLDNQANTSVIHPKLLTDIRMAETPTKVSGLSGHKVTINMVGYLRGFFDVLAYHKGAANVLCMADVEELYDITYRQGESYTVHMDEGDLTFYLRNKIYVGDMRELIAHQDKERQVMVTTMSDREKALTTGELRRVRAARELIKAAGYPSLKEAIHLVEDGNLVDCKVTGADIRLTFKTDTQNGITPAMAKGKTVKAKQKSRIRTDDSLKSQVTDQQMYADVMHVEGQKFLLTVLEPLHLTLCTPIERETTHMLGSALQEQLDTAHGKGFRVTRVHCDPQAGLTGLAGKFPGTEIDIQGAGDHLAIVDAKIRRVKEMVRCIHSDLPWQLPRNRVPDLVAYAVSRINLRRTGASTNNVSPKVAFTGRKTRYSKELALSFGDYCEVPDPRVVGESMRSRMATTDRTDSCIALYPCSNEVGSWVFLNLNTDKTVRRSRWTLMVTPILVVARMAELAEKSKTELPERLPATTADGEMANSPEKDHQQGGEGRATSDTEGSEEQPHETATSVSANKEEMSRDTSASAEEEEAGRDDEEAEEGIPEIEGTSKSEVNNVEHETHSEGSDSEKEGGDEYGGPTNGVAEEERVGRRSRRIAQGVKKPDRYKAAHFTDGCEKEPHFGNQVLRDGCAEEESTTYHHAYHVSARKGLREYGAEAYSAIMKEFTQLYKVKNAIVPVRYEELPPEMRRKAIRSSLFLNPKHDAMGVFDKIKARLVANGKQQDRNVWTDRSSPTAMLESIMTVLTIAAREKRAIAGLDIGSAFLEALWIGEPVHIIIDKMLATIMSHSYPELKSYLRGDGSLVMNLRKALYGTLIAGKLWYDKLSGVLRSHGYVANSMDACVMNKETKSGKQITAVIYVDDILVTCEDEGEIEVLIEELKNEFDEVKGGVKAEMSYLGMHMSNNRAVGELTVSMRGYEEELLRYAGLTGTRKTPATPRLFETGDTKSLSAAELAKFHTLTAKLLYLSHRSRPEIGTAVSYLTTRVTCANKEDKGKLERVVMYIAGSLDNTLTLSWDSMEPRVLAYVDVAFGQHVDGKSQTGVVHRLGKATVLARSQKQKMVSKHSTEGELVGLTDRVDGVLRLNEFLIEQGIDMKVPVIFQDNQSTILLAEKGGGKYRNIHLRVRQKRIQEMIECGEVSLKYMPTGSMLADILTKPLQGFLFLVMVAKLTNREWPGSTGVR